MTTTSFRRRAAAVATGTLAAGALSFVPAMAGISTAHAAPTDLGYSCVMSGFGAPVTLDSTLSIEVGTPAAAVAPGAGFTSTISASLDMGTTAMGPVSRLSGTIDVAVLVAGESKTVTIPVADWTPAAGELVFAGTVDSELTAPAAVGDAAIEVGAVSAALKATVGAVNAPVNVPCTADEGQDQKVGTVTVGDDAPFGNARCEIDMTESGFGGKDTYDVEIAHAITAPSSATVGKAFTPTIATSLKFGQPFVDYMVTSPTKTIGVVANATTTAGGAAGTASVDLGEWNRTWTTPTPIGSPIEAIELSGTGSFAPITPTAAGSLPLSVTGLDGDISMTVSFGNMKSTYPLDCTMNEGAAPATAEVSVAEAPVVVAPAAATKTAVKTAYAKKAKKLTAKVTVTSAKAKPAGKATLVLKKGKKQVGKATVNIKKGTAKAVFKKIAKGNYKLTVKYAGNKKFKASSKTITVKIK
ncbi:Ig-like domain repeat protein [Nocardioides sp. zg-DK7169]|uniref:Ig-like domain repeat protein n=1 Tax=Nocardioides sp. zg-DK7169 TaxID=2736600 RepID=UPI001551F908|nr:Ig-like domain repeat protein [Nocardioides sp. zg-DK7169]NPC98399.1 hypothetical protein [Nocardioides sp. zg-DK7169]